jgi:hypothetical protein
VTTFHPSGVPSGTITSLGSLQPSQDERIAVAAEWEQSSLTIDGLLVRATTALQEVLEDVSKAHVRELPAASLPTPLTQMVQGAVSRSTQKRTLCFTLIEQIVSELRSIALESPAPIAPSSSQEPESSSQSGPEGTGWLPSSEPPLGFEVIDEEDDTWIRKEEGWRTRYYATRPYTWTELKDRFGPLKVELP